MTIPKEKEKFVHKMILNLITVSSEFKSLLQVEFPEIYSDIESASTNPNCSCVGKVQHELLKDNQRSLDILNNFSINNPNNEKIKEIFQIDYVISEPELLFGKTFKIDNTPESFSQFVQDNLVSKQVAFRSFSTSIDSDNKLNIYFV